MSFLNIHQGDSAIWGTASYNADGLVEEILCHAGIKTTKWHLTWVDGDGIRVAMRQSKHNIIREGYTYYYDTDNEANDKRRSVRVNRLAIPCGRFPARRPFLPAQPSRSLAFPHTALGKETALMDNAPLAVIAGADPRSPMLLGFVPVVASRHRANRHVIPSLQGECIYDCGLAVPCLCLVYTLFMPCLCLVYA